MNARSYRVNVSVSPLDFPAVDGIVENTVVYHSEPFLNKDKIILTITKKFIFFNTDNKKQHEVLSVKSDYEIPCSVIESRIDVYDFYKDALLGLDEAYKYLQTQIPLLPSKLFPSQPIENYQPEIDRVFSLLIRQN